MSKILQGGNIWATNLDYMNDAREYRNGLQEIRKLLNNKKLVSKWIKKTNKVEQSSYTGININEVLNNQIEKAALEASSSFTISFCKQKDLLSQWTTYARESGVCLEMQFDLSADSKFLLHKKNENYQDVDDKKRGLEVYTRPEEIFYFTKGRHPEKGESQYQEVAFKILDYLFREYQEKDALDEYLPAQWIRASVFVKQYDFFQEEEYRLAFDTSLNPQIGYRSDNHVLKPYLDVESEHGWPIASIMVGPGFNQSLVYKSIKFFLNHENIKSSLLHTKKQWEMHILSYLKKSTEISKEWDKWSTHNVSSTNSKQLYDFFDSIRDLKEENLMVFAGRDNLHRQIMKIVGMYKNDYFDQHYFSKSGIILEKSQIPYIF